MRAPKQESVTVPQPADEVFAAALGVHQGAKSHVLLAVHDVARRIIVREKSMMSNRKFHVVHVEDTGAGSTLHVVVGTDPRTQKALMDGKANQKSLDKYVTGVREVLAGSASAPVTPVENFYVQKGTGVPWTDPAADPDIELDGNLAAVFLGR